MGSVRRWIAALGFALVTALGALSPQPAAASPDETLDALRTWYRLVLELVRHTPTYSPPVASRSFAYLGVTAFETVATGSDQLQSLAGQLPGLTPLPAREKGLVYDNSVLVQAAMAYAAQNFFSNTGPIGQRAMTSLHKKLRAEVTTAVPPDVIERSEALGEAIAKHVLVWSQNDGGAVIENMGFPLVYELKTGPSDWVPTSLIAQQQKPLLPNWGTNRPFAMPDVSKCDLPPPPAYSEDKTSEFYKQAIEVYDTVKKITPEQRAIARFWSDDPMLSPTPPGHWISIALQVLKAGNATPERSVDVLARVGIAMADAFIGNWRTKYQYNILRPITYIRRVIDPKWEPVLNTPPFPEYPSGHSTQSGAAAAVLTDLFGENFVFDDGTHEADGMPTRSYPSFWAAAEEAGISRLYGGIHFRAAIDQGLAQGRCIGAFTNALKTRK